MVDDDSDPSCQVAGCPGCLSGKLKGCCDSAYLFKTGIYLYYHNVTYTSKIKSLSLFQDGEGQTALHYGKLPLSLAVPF